MAGALNIVRSAPTGEWGGKVQLTGGSWDLRELRGLLNTPLGENGGLKLYASASQHDGYMEATVYDGDLGAQGCTQYGAKISYEFTENFDVSFTAERIDDESDVGAWSKFNSFADLPA
ncbi:hypothetical protein A3709_13600 [Halioglobus sp. HI00S01]|uniref:hypothetical protein n=1 Tax=Halioglobus sp. HI00S01 TaxID=1822214 RepID=UPI0007C3BCF8|nr:hypothetical protein [Halioglobus sp. HI00S01]KZX59330.1 hypothetical protein A3709_13600 [Halioglobus sp. HI00S01]